jgi:hypothetical protein
MAESIPRPLLSSSILAANRWSRHILAGRTCLSHPHVIVILAPGETLDSLAGLSILTCHATPGATSFAQS